MKIYMTGRNENRLDIKTSISFNYMVIILVKNNLNITNVLMKINIDKTDLQYKIIFQLNL